MRCAMAAVALLNLKRQEPRLRDWNMSRSIAEMRGICLKRQEPRLRDWNLLSRFPHLSPSLLKRQEPRLRDWNPIVKMPLEILLPAWNDKNLDYEIETLPRNWIRRNRFPLLETTRTSITRLKLSSWFNSRRLPSMLETTRTSITRLKLTLNRNERRQLETWNDKNLDYEIETVRYLSPFEGFGISWNDKNLDYEIETWRNPHQPQKGSCLETTRTSITRLKLEFSKQLGVEARRLETTRTSITRLKQRLNFDDWLKHETWNDKNLDYEIETRQMMARIKQTLALETTRTSITRLKLYPSWKTYPPTHLGLKRQEPRLRDWNVRMRGGALRRRYLLETTRTSITRLKQGAVILPAAKWRTWNDKNLDYEIETSM